MMQAIAIVKLILELMPLILQCVKSLEQAFPEGGQGALKLSILRAMIETTMHSIEGLTVTFESAWPAIDKVVTAIVAFRK